jgi:hypothetical protein
LKIGGIYIPKEFIAALNKKCPNEFAPCSFTFKIGENLQSFNDVINVFTKHAFSVENFVDDHMCVLSREKDGINEAVKISKNHIEIKAWRTTLVELSEDLAEYCKSYDED